MFSDCTSDLMSRPTLAVCALAGAGRAGSPCWHSFIGPSCGGIPNSGHSRQSFGCPKLAVRSCGLTERLRDPDDPQGMADIGTSLPFPAASSRCPQPRKRTNDRRLASSRHDKSSQCFQHAGRTAQMGEGLEAATIVLPVKMHGQRMMELVENLSSVARGGD